MFNLFSVDYYFKKNEDKMNDSREILRRAETDYSIMEVN
jgi:hypothetical protein